jgi:hypothetical protein
MLVDTCECVSTLSLSFSLLHYLSDATLDHKRVEASVLSPAYYTALNMLSSTRVSL